MEITVNGRKRILVPGKTVISYQEVVAFANQQGFRPTVTWFRPGKNESGSMRYGDRLKLMGGEDFTAVDTGQA